MDIYTVEPSLSPAYAVSLKLTPDLKQALKRAAAQEQRISLRLRDEDAVLTVNGVEHIFSLSAQQTGKCELLQLDTLSPGQPRAEDDFDSFDAPGGSRRAVPLAAVHARLAPQRTLDAQVKSKLRASGEAEVAKAKQRAAVLVEGERVAGVKKKKSHLSAPPSSSALAAQAQARQARAATPPLMGTAGVGPGSSGKLQGSSNRPPLPPSRPSPAPAPAAAAAAAQVPSAAAGGVGGSGVGAAYVAGKAQGQAPTPPPLRKSLDPPKPKSLQGAKVGGGASGSAPKRSTPPPPPVTVAAAPVSSSAPQKAGGTSAGNGGGIGGGSGGLGPASMAAGGSIGPGGPAGLASHSAAAATRPGTGKSEPLLGRSHSPAEGPSGQGSATGAKARSNAPSSSSRPVTAAGVGMKRPASSTPSPAMSPGLAAAASGADMAHGSPPAASSSLEHSPKRMRIDRTASLKQLVLQDVPMSITIVPPGVSHKAVALDGGGAKKRVQCSKAAKAKGPAHPGSKAPKRLGAMPAQPGIALEASKHRPSLAHWAYSPRSSHDGDGTADGIGGHGGGEDSRVGENAVDGVGTSWSHRQQHQDAQPQQGSGPRAGPMGARPFGAQSFGTPVDSFGPSGPAMGTSAFPAASGAHFLGSSTCTATMGVASPQVSEPMEEDEEAVQEDEDDEDALSADGDDEDAHAWWNQTRESYGQACGLHADAYVAEHHPEQHSEHHDPHEEMGQASPVVGGFGVTVHAVHAAVLHATPSLSTNAEAGGDADAHMQVAATARQHSDADDCVSAHPHVGTSSAAHLHNSRVRQPGSGGFDHAPGRGSANTETHDSSIHSGLDRSETTLDGAWDSELEPYVCLKVLDVDEDSDAELYRSYMVGMDDDESEEEGGRVQAVRVRSPVRDAVHLRHYEQEYKLRYAAYSRLNDKQARVVTQAQALQVRADAAATPQAAHELHGELWELGARYWRLNRIWQRTRGVLHEELAAIRAVVAAYSSSH